MAEHGPFLRALSLFFSLSVRRQSLSPDCGENVAEIPEKDERTSVVRVIRALTVSLFERAIRGINFAREKEITRKTARLLRTTG